MKNFVYTFALFVIFGCESAPKPNGNHAPTETVVYQFDHDALITRVELARDRKFQKRPTIEGETEFSAIAVPQPEAVKVEVALLDEIFRGDRADELAYGYARYDKKTHTVAYDVHQKSAEQDVFLALVSALDHELTAPKPADSVDAWYARRALDRAAPHFALLVDQARRVKPGLDLDTIASRPDLAFSLQDVSSRLYGYSEREGLAFAAAMYRANGWSGVEYALSNPPAASGHVSRPDRWLKGEKLGTWTLSLTEPPETFSTERTGSVGSAYLESWLKEFLPQNAAASVHQSWLSDHYAYHTAGDVWVFEYLSMWNTPADAQSMVEAIDHGLRQTKRDALFAVVRRGNVIALVGTSSKANESELARAARLVESTVRFQYDEPSLLKFVATNYDQLIAGQKNTKQQNGVIVEPASGLRFPVDFDGWEVEIPENGTLRWYARRENRQIQCNVELSDPLGVALSDMRYGEAWQGRFRGSLQGATVHAVGQEQIAGYPGWFIDVSGKRETESVRIRGWQFQTGAFVTTLSLINGTDDDLARFRAFLPTIAGVQPSDIKSKGSIQYTVE